jgi:hypothetical protein
MDKKSQAQLKQEIDAAAKKVKVGAIYAHYKNPSHAYKVLRLAVNTQDDAVWVVYQGLYEEQLTFLRSAEEWCEEVEKDGRVLKRFVLAEEV